MAKGKFKAQIVHYENNRNFDFYEKNIVKTLYILKTKKGFSVSGAKLKTQLKTQFIIFRIAHFSTPPGKMILKNRIGKLLQVGWGGRKCGGGGGGELISFL